MVSVSTETSLNPSLSEPRSAGKRDRAEPHESFASLVDANSLASRADTRSNVDPSAGGRRLMDREPMRDSQPVSASNASDRSRAPQRSDAPRGVDAADRRSSSEARDSKADAPAADKDKPSREAASSGDAGAAKADDSASQDTATSSSPEADGEAAKADAQAAETQAVAQTVVEAVPVAVAATVTAPTAATAATTPTEEPVSAALALAALQADATKGEPQPAVTAEAAADQAAPAPHLAAMVAQATAAKTAIKTTATGEQPADGDGTEQTNAAAGEAKPKTLEGEAGSAAVLTDTAGKGEHKAEHKAAQHAAQNEAAAQGTAQSDAPVAPRHHADANGNGVVNQLSAAPDQVLTPAPTQQLQPSSQLSANGLPTTQWTANVATNAAVPMNRLAIEIAATAQAGNSRFEIRLDPAELGRVDVRIEVDRHGNVTSHLTVEKPETLAMLRNDAQQLQRALDDAGLKTSDSGLQFSLRDQSSGQNQNSDDQQPHYHRLEIGEEEVPPAAVIGRNYGRMLGAAGGVDIRV